jgi:hypothetical protein
LLHGYFDLPTFTFFDEKNIWTGSLYKTFNYRIIPVKKKTDDGDESELTVKVWYGTLCYDKIENFEAEYHEEFSAKGLENAIEHLTAEFEKYKGIRKNL